jgi:ferredoxin hydrogenase small subunit
MNFIQKGFLSSRRGFFRFLGMVFAMMILGIRFTSKAYSKAQDYLTMRIKSVYAQDQVMKYRKSQDNPSVKRLYKEWLLQPMYPDSEKYLHAIYIDRSQGIKKFKETM